MSHRTTEKLVPDTVVTAIVCDHCGKIAECRPPTRRACSPAGWVNFSSYHSEWGNDSPESHETHDACSWACYVAIVRGVLKEWPDYPTLTIDDRDLTFIRDMLAHQSEGT